MKKYLSYALMVATLAVGVFAVQSSNVSAQSSATNSTNTFKISPLRTDLEIAPGKTGVVKVKVTNITDTPSTMQLIQNDFVAGDEKGTPALILDTNEFAPTHSLKRFMVPLNNIEVPAKSTYEVAVEIKVPADAAPGGYFGAIRFAPVPGDGSGEVSLSASAASIILMSVPGDTTEKLNMTDFDITQGGKPGSFFQSANDLDAAFRLENKGNIQLGPFGSITVTQGDKVVYTHEFNEEQPRDMILPDSARRWEIPLKNIGTFGNYKVTAVLTYGKKNQTINIEKSFWVVPLNVMIGAIVGVLLLIGLIVGIWLFLRSYKRRILSGGRGGVHRR